MAVNKGNIRNFLKRINQWKLVNIQEKRMKPPVHFSEIVKDVNDFQLFQRSNSSLLDVIIPPKKRSLRPNVKSRILIPTNLQKQQYQNSSKNCRLLVTIVGAMNVPSRVFSQNKISISKTTPNSGEPYMGKSTNIGTSNESDANEKQSGNDVIPSNTFVQVIFQGRKLKTRRVVGSSPMWKQTLDFEINPGSIVIFCLADLK